MLTPVRRHVLMFQPRFVELVRSGEKTQTIRPPRQRRIRQGDLLDLRHWADVAYRSKHVKIARCPAQHDARAIEIHADQIVYPNGGGPLRVEISDPLALNAFAAMDGFNSWADLQEWFTKAHRLPFRGSLITWEATPL